MHEDFRLEAPIDDDLRLWCAKVENVLSATPTHRLADVYIEAFRAHSSTYPMILTELQEAWKRLEQAGTAQRERVMPEGLREPHVCGLCCGTGYNWIKNQAGDVGVHPCRCHRAPAGRWELKPGWEPVAWLNARNEWQPVNHAA